MNTKMKRFNFDKTPKMAQGFGVHAKNKRSAWIKAYSLAKKNGYYGQLQFRDNKKCPAVESSFKCNECHT